MAIKIRGISLKNKKIILLFSPNKLTLFEIKKFKNKIKIINKIEADNLSSSSNKEVIDNFLKSIRNNYVGEQINVVLNLPKFFIQKFDFPNLEKIKNSNILENKIKEELPIRLEKYFWKAYYHPQNYENVMVIFYEKEILENITNQLLLNNFLPIDFQPIFSIAINFIREKYALAFDKSYLILIFFNKTLTILIYENGFLTNIFSEEVESVNKQEIIERMVNSLIRNFTLPLNIFFLITDEEIDLNFLSNQDIKIIDIQKETNLSIPEIISWSILKKESLSEFSLNIYNLEKDIIFYNFNNSLKLFLIIGLIIGLIINLSLVGILKYFQNEKLKITKEISSIKESSPYSIEELKKFISDLKTKTLKMKIYQNLNFLKNFKNYKIISIKAQNNKSEIIIEENDPQKRENILNYLKNDLKLKDVEVDNNLILIKINFPNNE